MRNETTINADCTCKYPHDCCPKCFREQKARLQSKLWDAVIEEQRLFKAVITLHETAKQHNQAALQERLDQIEQNKQKQGEAP